MKNNSKKTAGLHSSLYDAGSILDRDNYVSITGGLEDVDGGNKSDVSGGYNDTKNLGTGGYDQAVNSLIDVTDTKNADDKPA